MLYSPHSLSGYPMISHAHHAYTTTSTATDSLYTPPYTQIKMEYPPCVPGSVSSCMQVPPIPSSYMVPMAPPPCTSATGLSMPSNSGHGVVPSSVYSSSISSTGRSLENCHISEVCNSWWCCSNVSLRQYYHFFLLFSPSHVGVFCLENN